jgi:hypothetical protein
MKHIIYNNSGLRAGKKGLFNLSVMLLLYLHVGNNNSRSSSLLGIIISNVSPMKLRCGLGMTMTEEELLCYLVFCIE